jgi:hypothetical protein
MLAVGAYAQEAEKEEASPQTRPQSRPRTRSESQPAEEVAPDSPREMIRGSLMYRLLPPDSIPSIDDPKFVTAGDAIFMRDDEPVLGVDVADRPKAYSLYQLERNEVVNDTAGALPIAATW